MSRFAIDPPDEDRYEVNPDHEAEAQRQQAWDLFVASLRDAAHAKGGWGYFTARLWSLLFWTLGELVHKDIEAFANLYGWPDTLRAIAQAMQADDTAKQEAMDRR